MIINKIIGLFANASKSKKTKIGLLLLEIAIVALIYKESDSKSTTIKKEKTTSLEE